MWLALRWLHRECIEQLYPMEPLLRMRMRPCCSLLLLFTACAMLGDCGPCVSFLITMSCMEPLLYF